MSRFPRQVRWAVPAGIAATVAAATAGSLIGVAQAAPGLPPRTPAQLLAAAASSTTPPPALTGTVSESASLGIPQIPGMDSPSSITSLLTGTHIINVWYSDPKHVRLASPAPLGETDVIRDGTTAWLWQSASDSVTEFTLPSGGRAPSPAPTGAPLTPQQAAQQALAAVGPTTKVSVAGNMSVAGEPAYQLVLTPRDRRSLIGQVTIALDSQHLQLPLQVQVYARGASTPAFQIGYTSLAFGAPPASAFDFTPPPGAHVRRYAPAGHGAGPMTGHKRQIPAAGAPAVIGKGWLSVAVVPSSALTSLGGAGNAAGLAGQSARSISGAGGNSGGVSSAAVMGAVLQAATPVHGSWGSGKLLRTSLVDMLVTDNGHVLVGAVTPSVLYAAAARVK